MSLENNSGGQQREFISRLRPHKITNAASDRELILIWLGGKSDGDQFQSL
ncbi:hypothetical protein [Pleurocapsa sp. FMAR1]|nr:hypothetical protein [Pleurocapsa sp. FMAR1]